MRSPENRNVLYELLFKHTNKRIKLGRTSAVGSLFVSAPIHDPLFKVTRGVTNILAQKDIFCICQDAKESAL